MDAGYLQILVDYVGRIVDLSPTEASRFKPFLKTLKVKKKQFIVQPGFVAQSRYYVVKGALRAYLVDAQGQEHTISLAVEDWWISDFSSFVNQQPATLFVEAVEASELIQLDYEAEQKIMSEIPIFERFFRIMTQRAYAHLQQRVLSNISKTAEQRYEEFLNKYPLLAARFPQYILASYLGFSTEFLSKIRNKKMKK